MNLRALPKVELHLHMDMSLSYEAVAELAPAVTPDDYKRDYAGKLEFTNLTEFLSRTPNILALEQDERGLRVMVKDMFRQLAADSMLYAEVRFAPLQHLRQGLSAADVVRIVEHEVDRQSKDTGIESRIILCTLRHYSADQGMETVRLAHDFAGSRVAAFDLAGDEANFPLETHLEAFRYAHAHGIAITSHAGESKGAESVWETLEQVKPARIGHGVHSIQDAALVQHLKRIQMHLEICPTCNVQLNGFPSYDLHPIDTLYREGLSLGISTDNRTLTPITLTNEYERMAATFGWTKADFVKCNLFALDAAFIPPTLKDELRRRLVELSDKVS